jgi:hypothetical protein
MLAEEHPELRCLREKAVIIVQPVAWMPKKPRSVVFFVFFKELRLDSPGGGG